MSDKIIKSINRLYLDPKVVVDLREGDAVPESLQRYRNKLIAVGVVAPPAVEQAPKKLTKKREK